MDDPFSQVRVGVGVMVWRDGRVLLGRRKGAHGAGQWSFPGGHLEKGESILDCAQREVREECGLEIQRVRFQFGARSSAFLPRDYLHIGVVAASDAGEPLVLEPDKCDGWEWWRDQYPLPSPMFLFAELAFDAHNHVNAFYDADDVEAYLRRQPG